MEEILELHETSDVLVLVTVVMVVVRGVSVVWLVRRTSTTSLLSSAGTAMKFIFEILFLKLKLSDS